MTVPSAMAVSTPGGTRLPRMRTPGGRWAVPKLQRPQPEPQTLEQYFQVVTHDWARTLTALGFTLVPLSFVLDYVMAPPELLGRFTAYRAAATAVIVAQALVLRGSSPGRASYLHGYFFSLVLAAMIARMTTHLGGFNSAYYASLSLVMVAVNLMLPWRAIHSAINSACVIGIYVAMNLTFPSQAPAEPSTVLNNLYYLAATGTVTVAITWVKERLIRQEFFGRRDLQKARDALFSEMAVAKRIQTSLLPRVKTLPGWQVAAAMVPADEVGGDYYDVLVNPDGELWAAIGDVSGHGVESGLIMMMTQTSISTVVSQRGGLSPSQVLRQVNGVLTENVARLGTDRYMTAMVLVVREGTLHLAGKHQDLLIWRADQRRVEVVPTTGSWLGVVPQLEGHVIDQLVPLGPRDVVLLFTDGVTEAADAGGKMYGQERLVRALEHYADLELDALVSRIVSDVRASTAVQTDDLTLVALRRSGP